MKRKFYALLFSCSAFGFATAQPILAFTQATTITGVTGLVDIVSANDGTNRLFLVQRNGIIKIWNGSAVLATPFIDISTTISAGGEEGLLSLAFHPNYATNGYFFLYYTNTSSNIALSRYSVSANPNIAVNAGTVLLTIPHPTFTNHNGGKLNFGPDGFLYFGTGDGGSSNDPNQNSQNIASLLGKMLRIDVNGFATANPFYSIPPTNPFLVPGDGVADEIYALGLRNPWRWSFDRLNGDMWIADVGQNAWEEINYRPAESTAGLNYQWRCSEGLHPNTASGIQPCNLTVGSSTPPVFEYFHNSAGGFSVTGGYVYRGAEFTDLQGWYICADYVRPNAFMVKPNGIGGYQTAVQSIGVPANISTFGEAENGTLYAGTLSGTVYKVVLSGFLPVTINSFTGNYQNNTDVLQWRASIGPTQLRFDMEKSIDGTRFTAIGSVLPQTLITTASYQFSTVPVNDAKRFYRLKITYADGMVQYSSIVEINNRISDKIRIVNIGNGQLQLTTPYPIKQLYIINNTGQRVKFFTSVNAGSQMLQTGYLPAGIYWVQCVGEKMESFKVIL